MTIANTSLEYQTALQGCSITSLAKPESECAEANRLGGLPPHTPIALAGAAGHDVAMKLTVLTLAERIELHACLRAGWTLVRTAAHMGRSASALSVEIKRNGGRQTYCAERAHRAAFERKAVVRRGHCKIEQVPPLRAVVHDWLRRGWSPEEIAGKLRRAHPDHPHMHTSHESIYRYVYVVARGELKRELVACLRRHHAARRPRRRGVASAQGQLKDMVLVDQRPPEVETRLIPGHYEGDLIVGAGNRSAVGVLVERTTRYTMLCHLPQKDAQSVREAFERKLAPLPGVLRQSLTYDQGKEMAEHQTLAANLKLKVFFCHAHSPWERATCESQNDRIRHYLPKGIDLSVVSHQQLRAYQDMLNERPRKILGWRSPAECFQELLIANQHSN